MNIELLKSKLRSSRTLGSFYYLCRFIYRGFLLIAAIFFIFLRKKNIGTRRYEKLLSLKNKYIGQRCFIIGTGPSLTFEDLEKLKDEKTLAVNSIVSAYDKMSYKPTFYGIQDGGVFRKLKEKIYECDFPNIFWGREYINRKYVKDGWIEYPLFGVFTSRSPVRIKNKFPTKFSDDCSVVVYDGYTVVYSMLQIAVFLGFTEIYLLGCDCNYQKDKKNFFDYSVRTNTGVSHRMIAAYKEAKNYADGHGIKIYNATRGGMLEVFERVDLDRVVSREK